MRNIQLRLPTLCVLALAVVGLSSTSAAAGIITVPPGLAPGSQYRLVFNTVNVFTATSSNIADYNTDVNTEADSIAALAALGTTWTAIASTESVNAITNIGSDPGVPIYGLNGTEVVSDATTGSKGLFSGSLLAPILFSETGVDETGRGDWTGTSPTGVANATHALGDSAPVIGLIGDANGTWIDDLTFPAGTGFPLYGISGVLTVPSAAPEPATTMMLILGGALMIGARRRMSPRKNRATRTLC